ADVNQRIVDVHLVANRILDPPPGVRVVVDFVTASEVVVQATIVKIGEMESGQGIDGISGAVQHGATRAGWARDPITNPNDGCVGLKNAVNAKAPHRPADRS